MDDRDHLENTQALGGLRLHGPPELLPDGRERRAYVFPIGQGHPFRDGMTVEVTKWESCSVRVVAIDNDAGAITFEAPTAKWEACP
jgi:hypothetical protein